MEGFDATRHNAAQVVTVREAAAALGWSEAKARRAMKGGAWRFTTETVRGAQVYRIAFDSLPAGADWQRVEVLRQAGSLRRGTAEGAIEGVEAVRLRARVEALEALFERERAQRVEVERDLGQARGERMMLEASAQHAQEGEAAARAEAIRLGDEVARARRAVRWSTWALAIATVAALVLVGLRLAGW